MPVIKMKEYKRLMAQLIRLAKQNKWYAHHHKIMKNQLKWYRSSSKRRLELPLAFGLDKSKWDLEEREDKYILKRRVEQNAS